jgi:hypothetical protein
MRSISPKRRDRRGRTRSRLITTRNQDDFESLDNLLEVVAVELAA